MDVDRTENEMPTTADEIEEVLRDVGAFLDDPIALLERAVELLRRRGSGASPEL